jgi:hypothetical protein
VSHAEPEVAPQAPPASAPTPAPLHSQAVVVPVKLPANGSTGEIVIRIVFDRQD